MEEQIGMVQPGALETSLKERLDESEALFRSTGHFHGIRELALKKQDPLRYELFHARLLSTVIAAREVAKQISSSVMTREEGELSFALYTPEGDSVVFSTGIMVHIGVMGNFIKWMIANGYEDDPGISEGDHFANNDVLISAVHVPDVYFATPIFHEGAMVGWSSGVTHVLEVGSITPGGGMSSLCVERQLEGIHICAEKVAANDRLRRDYELRIRRNTRLASFWLLDDRARITGNVFIREEVKKIIDEFGLAYYLAAIRELIEEGRLHHLARVRERLIPGRYRNPAFHASLLKGRPGVLPQANRDTLIHFPVELTVRPSGGMVLDLEGASGWGFHNLNAPPGSIFGGLSITLAQTLDYDGRANSGSIRNVELRLPVGSIVNPDYDFVATGFSWGSVMAIFNGVLKCMSRGFFGRGYVEEVLTGGNITTGTEFGGKDQYGRQTGGVNVEVCASASGARGVMDGIDTAWSLWNPEGDQGNAEMWELLYPHLYLGRRVSTDSGGAGKRRGGCTFESLWMTHNSDFVLTYQIPGIVKLATNYGIFGGYGGGPAYIHLAKTSNVMKRIAARLPIPHGEGDPERPEMSRLLKGDILCGLDAQYISEPLGEGALYEKLYLPGGGGYGDPLDRDEQQVEHDVALHFVSAKEAGRMYGVAGKVEGDEWKADARQSKELRTKLRKRRLARAVPVKQWWRAQRERIIGGKIKGETAAMYADCLGRSPAWAKSYRDFWGLPGEFVFAASTNSRNTHRGSREGAGDDA
ncbi:MAG TPA: hydantoinase B/oxoprolinase family protein [Candidatus Binataceae bacterium]|nr:hydantoinase B/oxoprolinase family protein [Candidatus Binataceae bacterium]